MVIHDADGRIQGFQEKPDPAEALSNLGNCGIYCFSPEIFDYFPKAEFADWAQDVFPALLENDVPFYIHETQEYWNDVGSLAELKQGTFDALQGKLRLEASGSGTDLSPGVEVDGDVWVGEGVEIGDGVRLMGPVVIGDGCRIGDGAALRDTIVFPGTEVAPKEILIGAIHGHEGIAASLRKPH